MKNRYGLIALVILFVLAIAAAFSNANHPITEGISNPADLAWILTASAFVLVMTPGLSFFLWGDGF